MGLMFIDGVLIKEKDAGVFPLTWGCSYGYGLFETILVYRNRAVFLEEHLQRLLGSARFLQLAAPSREILMQWTSRYLEQTKITSGRLKIVLQALGRADRGIVDAQTLITGEQGLPYQDFQYQRGIHIGFLTIPRNERSLLVTHKTLNYLENILARELAREKGWFEGVFCNYKGFVCEGSFSNLFLVSKNDIITPGQEEGLLPGITRERIMALARQSSLHVREEPVSPEDVKAADEVFLTSSLMGIMPVVRVGDCIIGEGCPGKLTNILRRAYEESLETV